MPLDTLQPGHVIDAGRFMARLAQKQASAQA